MGEREIALVRELDGFEEDARGAGVPEKLIAYARAAAHRKFDGTVTDGGPASRARAYAHGVVTRRSVRERGSRSLAARYTLWSIAADLRDSGRPGSEICDELVREWGSSVPEDLIAELRERLCA